MICSKCGNSIPEEDDFCPKCGHKITAEEHSYVTGIVKSSTMSTLRSPLFGAVCVFFFGFMACIVAGWFMPLDFSGYADALSEIDKLKSIADTLADFSDDSGKFQILKILALFIVALPTLLSTVGILLLRSYAKGRSRQTGIDVIKVGIRVGVIYFSILALCGLGGGVILIVFGGYSDPTSLVWSLPVFLFAMTLVGIGLILLVKLTTLAQIVKEAVTNDDFTEQPPKSVQVVSFILGIVGIIIGVAVLVFAFDYVTAVAMMFWAFAQIFLGMFVGKLRKLDGEFYEGLYDTVYKKPVTVEYRRSFCPRCGRELFGDEICSCVPKYHDYAPRYDRGAMHTPSAGSYGVRGGVKSTMPESGEGKSASPRGTSADKYFKRSKNL